MTLSTTKTVDLSTTVTSGPIDVQGYDTLYLKAERIDGSGSVTGVLHLQTALTAEDTPTGTDVIALDGTVTTINIEDVAYVALAVNTAQSGFRFKVHLYARPRSVRAFA